MKKRTLLPLLSLLFVNFLTLHSQNPVCETNVTPASPAAASSSNCDNCNSLDDYIPVDSDSILYVRLNFHYLMVNPTNPGHYRDVTITEAIALVDLVNNNCFDSLHKAALRKTPAPAYIKRPKIKFVLNSFATYYDSSAYFSFGKANWAALATYTTDPNAIDVIFKGDGSNDNYGQAIGIPGKAVKLSFGGANPVNGAYDWWFGTELLAHELGHTLGLRHTNEPYLPCVDDYYFETTTWNTGGGACDPSIDSTHSNNLMGYSYTCRYHMSPRQLARCHYNLRHTFLFNTLTPSSQVRARNVQSSADINTTTNQAWTIDRFIKGNIIVKTDKTLTISCRVAMTKDAKIIVEPGAQLIIDGGTVTNVFGDLWEGIFVQGKPSQPQLIPNPNNAGAVLYHGMLRIKNNGTISHAKCGVRNYLTSTANTGGVIFAQNSNFINNVKDVYMSVPYSGGQPSASWFYYCNFKTLGTISGNSLPIHHVELRNITGVKFRACHFLSGATPYSGGNGIFSVDAIYSVDNDNNPGSSVFENLVYGIYVNNINPLRTPLIANTTFRDNWYGAYFMNVNYLSFQTNTLSYVTRSGASHVYLNNCKYYKVKNNSFSSSTNSTPNGEGVSVYKSKTGAHEIFRNTFSYMNIGINCMDDNGNPNNATDGLKMNCNLFHITPNNYDVALTHASGLALPLVNKTQGQILGTPAATLLVRNIYGANCGNQNKWHIYNGSTATIDHGSNTNTVTAVTQPAGAGCKSSLLNVADMGISLNYPSHCPASPPSSGGVGTSSTARLAAMNDYISVLQDQRADAIAIGETPDDFELQSTVASKLNLLLSDSTLADTQEVINILEQNQGYMEDADIQTVFAYMHAGEYATALSKTNDLDTNRADWKSLLTEVIAFQQDTVNGMDSIGQGYVNFFTDYATSEDMDGKALAQALLMAASVSQYDEPHALPEENYSGRMANPDSQLTGIQGNETISEILVFPNPAKTGVYLSYNFQEEGIVNIGLKDLLGRVIFSDQVNESKSKTQYISLSELKAGMYLLSITKDQEIIYTTKIIKED